MSTYPATTPRTRAPRHLWVVGGLSLLWNAFGALDYTMTQFRVDAYMGQFTAEQLAFFYGFPWWADAAWAFGVWGGVAGSVGLLVRRRWAVWAFGVSLVGMVVSSLFMYGSADGPHLTGDGTTLIFSLLIWVVGVVLFVYALSQAKRDVLR